MKCKTCSTTSNLPITETFTWIPDYAQLDATVKGFKLVNGPFCKRCAKKLGLRQYTDTLEYYRDFR